MQKLINEWVQKKNLSNGSRVIFKNEDKRSVQELTEAFHEAVNDYLAYCEEEGIQPHKSYSGLLNVRLTPEIHSRVAMLAQRAGISINAFIKQALEKQITAML
ncbi:type II toxin-antitoxin system HicB family antitoxin [Bacteroides sp.]|mgnify:CR=1|uniref:type II toxin-antitoxin system HicB family antitoxin n=1 Tax=Bacteroides maternus TaxID=3117552 RepID=UPI0025C558AE|nr:type II toxin-antitoxin system HicB family antitoxin [Bacteroides sp.]